MLCQEWKGVTLTFSLYLYWSERPIYYLIDGTQQKALRHISYSFVMDQAGKYETYAVR